MEWQRQHYAFGDACERDRGRRAHAAAATFGAGVCRATAKEGHVAVAAAAAAVLQQLLLLALALLLLLLLGAHHRIGPEVVAHIAAVLGRRHRQALREVDPYLAKATVALPGSK